MGLARKDPIPRGDIVVRLLGFSVLFSRYITGIWYMGIAKAAFLAGRNGLSRDIFPRCKGAGASFIARGDKSLREIIKVPDRLEYVLMFIGISSYGVRTSRAPGLSHRETPDRVDYASMFVGVRLSKFLRCGNIAIVGILSPGNPRATRVGTNGCWGKT